MDINKDIFGIKTNKRLPNQGKYIDLTKRRTANVQEELKERKNLNRVKNPTLSDKIKNLKRSIERKQKSRNYQFKTASPISTSFSNAFGSPSTSLSRVGYSKKQIKSAYAQSKQRENIRKKRQRFAEKGFKSVIGF